jgi:signal transduction histidine kinase
VPIVAGPMLVLTYLLLHGATPDAALHEHILDALRAVILNDAALQRDVLKARAGLLRNYDPLVQSVENLRDAAATLQAAGRIAYGGSNAEIDRRLDGVVQSVADQENLVEAFKSRNALLQNSLSFSRHTIYKLASGAGDVRSSPARVIGALSNAMGRFTSEPRPDIGSEVNSLLDRLAQYSTDEKLPQEAEMLVPHGRLIVATLPELDELLSRLLAAPISERARSLQDLYLSSYGRAAARAGWFRILLYVASLALVAYVGYLFLRLRANARTLRARLVFEHLISAISTQFINLPRDRLDGAIVEALTRLARQSRVERAAMVFFAETGHVTKEYHWRHDDIPASDCRLTDRLDILKDWHPAQYESHGCVHVPRVWALPDSSEKAYLERSGVKSWLCIPMWSAGKRVGFFSLERIFSELAWRDDDIVLMRTAGEIFANAIEREHSQSEREALEARLQHGQRLEAVGTLAGGVAHEFNNILGAVLGYGELALTERTVNDQVRRYVRQIMVAGERAQRVVDQILAFSRRGERRLQLFRVQDVVVEAIELLRVSLPRTLTLQTHLEADEATMRGDPTQLQQVVMNLCTNGAQAMDGRGILKVSLNTIDILRNVGLTHGDLSIGRYIRLSVQDTGYGIDEVTMRRMFEPFFTTKPVGIGTGLGLASVHGIVTQHGGALNVQSRPNAGSTFEVYFPRSEEAAASERAALPTIAYGHGETILLVDDESSLVMLGEEMLAALRYEPVGFDSATAALASFRRDTQRFAAAGSDRPASWLHPLRDASATSTFWGGKREAVRQLPPRHPAPGTAAACVRRAG